MIKQYLRDKGNNKVGVMIARNESGDVKIGFSVCNTSHGDEFNVDLGEHIAYERADKLHNLSREEIIAKVKGSNMPALEKFSIRAQRYFRDSNFPAWVTPWDGVRRNKTEA